MEKFSLRRKVLFFVLFTGVIVFLLILIPFVEELLSANIASFKQAVNEYISGVFGKTEGMMAETFVSLLVQLFRILKVILWMSLIISIVRFLRTLIFSTAFRSGAYEISSLVQNVLSIIVYIVAFFIIFNSQYPNVDLAALFTTSTILGVIIGLALQDTLGNLFAGLAIQADQPFQIGDVISIPNMGTGVIENISWRGVKIRTFQNKFLIISNSVLGKEAIEVAPRENLNARLVFFNTIYTNSPAKTVQIVREAVRQIENVSQKIRPIVRVRDLGASGIDWEIKYWLEDYTKYNDTDALVRQRIWYAFQRERNDFAYPTQTIHIENKMPEDDFVETGNEVFERLSNVPIFAPLSDEETQKLASGSRVRVFAPDEPIVRQGQPGKSMFVVHKGSVKVQIKEESQTKTLNTLREGDFFGEMGLLTGEPRTATVIAEEETQVLEIDNLCLKPILEDNPELVESFSRIVEERRTLLAEKQSEKDAVKTENNTGVFYSIKKFFGLDS
ncbi:MAG TPA: mechanosensitive ion channel family protein [Pyrinomonadaceae bacterium]|nr:mechanosensitive ion channel family protein [Pyrinomonadaceae bacterium]